MQDRCTWRRLAAFQWSRFRVILSTATSRTAIRQHGLLHVLCRMLCCARKRRLARALGVARRTAHCIRAVTVDRVIDAVKRLLSVELSGGLNRQRKVLV